MRRHLRSLSAVRIFVSDLDRSRRFYRDVLGLDERSAAAEWAVFDIGGKDVVVEAVGPDDDERKLVGRFLAVSFDVDDVGQAYRDLTDRGAIFDQAPERQVWGGTLAFLRDPDGNTLTLVG